MNDTVTAPTATDRVVLIVDDNAADAELAREALEGERAVSRLCVLDGGEAALGFLRREGTQSAAPVPNLVLLDLNMPRVDGRAVLAAMKGDRALRDIPVVVFSTSDAPSDVAEAYALRANSYVRKPTNLTDYVAALHAIVRFWLEVATPPPNDRPTHP